MRWKAYFFDNPDNNNPQNTNLNFGFKSIATPPVNQYLTEFENDPYELVKNLEFRNVNNDFLNKLKEDIKAIQTSNNLFISADKTNNLYEISTTEYEKLLRENITKSYEKFDNSVKNNINKEAKKIAKSLNLDTKMECYTEQNAYITIKDHNQTFHITSNADL